MLQTKRGQAAALIAVAFALSACADSPMEPTSTSAVRLPTAVTRQTSTEVCETINFNQPHGTAVGNDFVTIFGNALDFSGVAYDAVGAESAADLRILDPFSPLGPDNDLRNTAVAGGQCASCTSAMLVINDPNDGTAAAPSDNAFGGEIVISGFPADAYIKSYQLADHEDTEAPSRLIVQGTNIAPAVQPGAEHEVITVVPTAGQVIGATGTVTFILGDQVTNTLGSEAIDNIEVCRLIIEGDEGCTPGYWKNHLDSWASTGFTTGQTLESVFNVPDALGMDNTTLLQALNFGGGPGVTGAAQILFRAAVAALLNAGHPDVDYTMTTAQIIAAVNAALATNDRDTILDLAADLDADNNLGCPIN